MRRRSIRQRQRKHLSLRLLFWLSVPLLISPIGFNCHQQTDQSAAVQRPVDSDDQTVRTMASLENKTPDGAPQGEPKVRLADASGTLSAAKASAMGMSAKLQSDDDQVVQAGTPLMALYDNTCLLEKGRMNGDATMKFEAVAMHVKDATSLAAMEAEAEQDPCLVRIDENPRRQWLQATVNDPRLAEAGHIGFSKALSAWDWFFSDAGIKNDVIVAVIDSGVSYNHPDLVDNVYTSSTGTHGRDFVNNDNDPIDDNGHGTHVSGIIAAKANNGIGVTGVMGTRVKIMGLKALDAAGGGDEAPIVNAIRYAADQGAGVINMSIGGRFTSIPIRDAISYAASRGVVTVMACGNDNANMNATNLFYAPAGYAKDIPGAIAVGSVDAVNGAKSSFSNYNPTYVWIGAPGSQSGAPGVLSTYLSNQYAQLQGTSMASPVVAGAAALLVGAFRSRNINFAPSEVVSILTDSARPVAALNANFRNGATLDIERAAKLFYSRHVMAGNGGAEIQ